MIIQISYVYDRENEINPSLAALSIPLWHCTYTHSASGVTLYSCSNDPSKREKATDQSMYYRGLRRAHCRFPTSIIGSLLRVQEAEIKERNTEISAGHNSPEGTGGTVNVL